MESVSSNPLSVDGERGGVIRVTTDAADKPEKPRLLFVYSRRDGRARRAEGYLAQVLQSRRNHDSFVVHRIDMEARPDLVARFRVGNGPALLVVVDRVLRGRLEPLRNVAEIKTLLHPWRRSPASEAAAAREVSK